jgi:hypothetical protein
LKKNNWNSFIQVFNEVHNSTMTTMVGSVYVKTKNNNKQKAKDWKERYPLVEVKWLDICSDSSWQSLKQLQEAKLPTCVTKGHLLSQAKGITRIFGDYSEKEDGTIEEIGNTTIIPNTVIIGISKI